MRVRRTNREQYRWALWAALILLLGAASLGYSCGADGRTDSGDDRAEDTGEVAQPDANAGTEATDVAAAHSAAWLDALDGLAVVGGDADDGGRGYVSVEEGLDGLGIMVGGDHLGDGTDDDGDEPTLAETVTPAPVYVAPPPTAPPSYATLDTSVQLSEARFEELLAAAGFDRYTWPAAKAVAWCESKWSPNATGAASERGTFQIHPIHADSTYDELGNFVVGVPHIERRLRLERVELPTMISVSGQEDRGE